jgi:putative glutamine amidotransferase
MARPIIGITTFTDKKPKGSYTALGDDYIDSVAAAGALPLALPTAKDEGIRASYLDIVDGLLFSGGVDVHPLRYGEQPARQIVAWNSARDEFEFSLFAEARARRIPILGICRGEQLINIALGGSLYQDIYVQVPGVSGHNPDTDNRDEPYHRIDFAPGPSLVRAAFGGAIGGAEGGSVLVNSFHHQAVKDLAPGLKVTATSPDGLVEAYEGEAGAGFLLCVQFHPECMTRRFPAFLGIFRALVSAAAEYSAAKA